MGMGLLPLAGVVCHYLGGGTMDDLDRTRVVEAGYPRSCCAGHVVVGPQDEREGRCRVSHSRRAAKRGGGYGGLSMKALSRARRGGRARPPPLAVVLGTWDTSEETLCEIRLLGELRELVTFLSQVPRLGSRPVFRLDR